MPHPEERDKKKRLDDLIRGDTGEVQLPKESSPLHSRPTERIDHTETKKHLDNLFGGDTEEILLPKAPQSVFHKVTEPLGPPIPSEKRDALTQEPSSISHRVTEPLGPPISSLPKESKASGPSLEKERELQKGKKSSAQFPPKGFSSGTYCQVNPRGVGKVFFLATSLGAGVFLLFLGYWLFSSFQVAKEFSENWQREIQSLPVEKARSALEEARLMVSREKYLQLEKLWEKRWLDHLTSLCRQKREKEALLWVKKYKKFFQRNPEIYQRGLELLAGLCLEKLEKSVQKAYEFMGELTQLGSKSFGKKLWEKMDEKLLEKLKTEKMKDFFSWLSYLHPSRLPKVDLIFGSLLLKYGREYPQRARVYLEKYLKKRKKVSPELVSVMYQTLWRYHLVSFHLAKRKRDFKKAFHHYWIARLMFPKDWRIHSFQTQLEEQVGYYLKQKYASSLLWVKEGVFWLRSSRPELAYFVFQKLVQDSSRLGVKKAKQVKTLLKPYLEKAEKARGMVYLPALKIYLDRYEVTVGEYAEFLQWVKLTRHLVCSPEEKAEFQDKDHRPEKWEEQKKYPGMPVRGVDWFDAYSYARWRGKSLLRLKEWEWLVSQRKQGKAFQIEQVLPPASLEEDAGKEVFDLFSNVREWGGEKKTFVYGSSLKLKVDRGFRSLEVGFRCVFRPEGKK